MDSYYTAMKDFWLSYSDPRPNEKFKEMQENIGKTQDEINNKK